MKNIFSLISLLLYVTSQAQDPVLIIPSGHRNNIIYTEVSPDSKYVITASRDNTVKIWHIPDGTLLREFSLELSIQSAKFSPDGKYFVTSSTAKTSRIFRISDGKAIPNYSMGTLLPAEFSPDGKYILTTLWDNSANIWKFNSEANAVIKFLGHKKELTDAHFSPNGRYIVTSSKDSTAKIWQVSTGKLVFDLKGHSDIVISANFSKDGKYVATSSFDGTAKIWQVSDGQLIANLVGHNGEVYSANFSPDGEFVVTRSGDRTAKVWRAKNGHLIADLIHKDEISSSKFSPNGKIIATTTSNGSVKLWEPNNGQLITEIKGHTTWIHSACFSPNGKYFITASGDKTAKIWELPYLKLTSTLEGDNNIINSMQFSADEKYFVTGSSDMLAKIWLVKSGEQTANLQGHSGEVTYAEFSPNGKYVVTASSDSTAKIWDVDFKKIITSLVGHNAKVNMARFSNDGKYVVTASNDLTARIWHSNNGKLMKSLNGHLKAVQSAEFSPDGKYVLTSSFDSTVKIWRMSDGTLITDFKHSTVVYTAKFSSDGKYIVIQGINATVNGKARIWEVSNGKLIKEVTQDILHGIASIRFSRNGNWLITTLKTEEYDMGKWKSSGFILTKRIFSDYNGRASSRRIQDIKKDFSYYVTSDNSTIQYFNTEKQELEYSHIQLGDNNYLIQLLSGYYFCSLTAAKRLHYVDKNLKVITFEQLDIKYNRPDKVLEVINSTDTALIKSYRKAYEKRIKKLGIDTSAFRDGYSVPEADFVNRETIDRDQKQNDLVLHIVGIDTAYKLDRYNIWVNEVPVYGQRGISIRSRNINNLDITATIHLSEGENKIETSITNVNGTESYRMPLKVDYNPLSRQKPIIHFVGIGIDKYGENKYNLQYSTKDIRDLSFKLKEKFGKDIVIDTLFNEAVSVDKVKVLKKSLLQTTENDKVIIAYSGHGVLSKDFDYYLSTYSMNFENPEAGGLSYDDLENLVDSIPARKKMMLIDACHSGELDKEDLVALSNVPDSVKGIKPVVYKQNVKHLGLKNSFELMQSLFVNVGKGTGAVIISAAAGTQFALESGNLKNGVFTFCILEAMDKYPTLRISELKKIVGERVEEITKGLQKPTSRNETIDVDWSIW